MDTDAIELLAQTICDIRGVDLADRPDYRYLAQRLVEKGWIKGFWMNHVEQQRAMKRERDGECICNTGPDTEGPDEFCPWHGRSYNELLEMLTRQQAQINGLT